MIWCREAVLAIVSKCDVFKDEKYKLSKRDDKLTIYEYNAEKKLCKVCKEKKIVVKFWTNIYKKEM